MAALPESTAVSTENLNPSPTEPQNETLQTTNTGASLDHEPSIEAQKEEATEKGEENQEIERESVDEETKQSKQNSLDKRKRESEEEEEDGGEKIVRHPMWKTSLCSFFRRQLSDCNHGETCRYAHSEEELRPRPDNSWDPTSERAKKLMKLENGEKTETFDDREDVFMTDVLPGSSDPSLDKCLLNLPKKWTSDNLKSFLAEQGILFKSARKKKGMTVGFVGFETADQVKTAIEGMGGKFIGNKPVKIANCVPRSFEKKTSTILASDEANVITLNGSEDGDTAEKDDSKVDGSVQKPRSVRDAVTPLAHLSYSEQLEHKKNALAQNLKRLTRNARKACPDGVTLPKWVLNSREIGGLPCRLEGIIESPLVNGYRNKCEFSVGYSLERKPTVGFMLGNFREGVTAVQEPVDCPNVSKISCKYASIFQDFLQSSGLPVWNRISNAGFWRQLTVREGRTPGQDIASISEVMLMVQVCSVECDEEVVTKELQSMALAFSQGANANSPPLPLTSLVVQDHQGISNVAPADAPLRTLLIPKAESASEQEPLISPMDGIHDYIGNLRFCISPTAFFQVNTLAAEKLYSLAGDWAGLGPETLLFDVCCGTGTIGLTLAHRVGMVVGIEMNASAVSDAKRNAEINNIKNCRFVCSKAEDVMGSLLKEYLSEPSEQEESPHVSESNDPEITNVQDANDGKGDLEKVNGETVNAKTESGTQTGTSGTHYKDVVVIVDPPRAGLHPTVIKVLRTHSSLRRLVYISCNPESLVANAIELCTPSTDKMEKGNGNNRGWRNMSSAGLARKRAKSMPISEPFRPIKAMAVDIFPHTPHCETVMLLER